MIDNCKWVYLLQLLRDPKAGVHLLPPLCVFGLIVFQEVTSGQLSSYEPDQGQVYKQEVHNGLHDHHWFDLTIQECHKYCFFVMQCYAPSLNHSPIKKYSWIYANILSWVRLESNCPTRTMCSYFILLSNVINNGFPNKWWVLIESHLDIPLKDYKIRWPNLADSLL